MMEKLREILKELMSREQPLSEKDGQLFEAVCSLKSDWFNSDNSGTMLRFYTSTVGHRAIFAASNRDVFQRDSAVADIDRMRTMVFFVELINIDLYKLFLKFPEKQHFAGTLYRGICVSPSILVEYKRILSSDSLLDRYIAVPLSLESATHREEKAVDSLRETELQEYQIQGDWKRLVHRIHVVDLRNDLLEIYQNRFPESVVTTICAMDVAEFSEHREEKEFLLRGAFYHVLGLYMEQTANDETKDGYLDTVVVNSNRDHPSSFQLGDRGDEARTLFGTLISITRYEFCINFFKGRDSHEYVNRYELLLTEEKAKLSGLLG